MQIDLAHARPAIASITGAAIGAMPVPMSSLATVQSGCDAMCWAVDEPLWVSARIAMSQTYAFTP